MEKSLDSKQVNRLIELIGMADKTLQDIEQQFMLSFPDPSSLFDACFAMSRLLNMNLLTQLQRLVALFLLYSLFRDDPVDQNPFLDTLLKVSVSMFEAYEQRMIAQLLIDGKRDKYAKMKAETIYQEQQLYTEFTEEREEIRRLRTEFWKQLPKISPSKKCEVATVLTDNLDRTKRSVPPEKSVNPATLGDEELGYHGFSIGYLRPVPRFIEISPDEFNWVSPGIITDVHWDNTAEIEKKLNKPKSIIKKALEVQLTKDECSEIEKALDSEPYAVVSLGVTSHNITSLIEMNPFIAALFLHRLAFYPIIGQFLIKILDSPITSNSLDVVTKVVRTSRIPAEFLVSYVATVLSRMTAETVEPTREKMHLASLFSHFLLMLMRNKQMDPANLDPKLEKFLERFIEKYLQIEEVQNLRKIVNIK